MFRRDKTKALARRRQTGFTLLEVLVAFSILIVVLAGTTTALTATMQLNAANRERSLAQDLVRDVVTKYVKSIPFDDTSSTDQDLTPYDEGISLASTYGTGYTRTLYDATVSPTVDHLNDYGVTLSYMQVDLVALDRAKLDLIFYPIKRSSTEYYSTKVNVVVRLTWDNNTRMIEMPTVAGEGDVTRATHQKFENPHVPTTTTVACTNSGQAPLSGSVCCTGLTLVNGLCITATCTPAGYAKSAYGNLDCCAGSTVDGSGTCIADATCTPAGSTRASTGNLACCTGTHEVSGSCVTTPSCTPAGATRAANGNAPCCSGTTETSGSCVAACTTAGQTMPSGGSCCSGLVYDNANNTCISCVAGFSTPPNGNATLCCKGEVFTSGSNTGQCKN